MQQQHTPAQLISTGPHAVAPFLQLSYPALCCRPSSSFSEDQGGCRNGSLSQLLRKWTFREAPGTGKRERTSERHARMKQLFSSFLFFSSNCILATRSGLDPARPVLLAQAVHIEYARARYMTRSREKVSVRETLVVSAGYTLINADTKHII